MQIDWTFSLGRNFLKDYDKKIQPKLKELTAQTAQRLVDYYERTAPRDTGAMAESFYIVTKDYHGYSDALGNFLKRRPKGWWAPPIPGTNSDYASKVGAVAIYTDIVDKWTPFLGRGVEKAQAYYTKRLEAILKGEGGDDAI